MRKQLKKARMKAGLTQQQMAEKMDSILLAVSEAVCKGDYTMDNYQWAFIVLQEMSGKLKGKLMEIANRAMVEYRKREGGELR